MKMQTVEAVPTQLQRVPSGSRALKSASHLQQKAPHLVAIGPRGEGFGENPGNLKPSTTGTVSNSQRRPGKESLETKGGHDRVVFTGRVVGLLHDHHGGFEGFLFITEWGVEKMFRVYEREVERLTRRAWTERTVISVFVERDRPNCPSSIIVRRAPAPIQI